MTKLEIKAFANRVAPRLHKIYVTLDHQWTAQPHVPTIKEIRDTVIELIGDVRAGASENSTGGITVRQNSSGDFEAFYDIGTLYKEGGMFI